MSTEEVIDTTQKYINELDVLYQLDPELDMLQAVKLWHELDKEKMG